VNILGDRHQADLYYSLQLLFEDRLGMTLYTPVGFEWFDEGYWRFGEKHFGRTLAEQYLNVDARWSDGGTHDPHHPERLIRGVTLAEAQGMDWGYVLASVQDNQFGFARFAREHGAQYLYSVGNTNQQIDWSLDPFALVSAEADIEGRGLRYHQEFDAIGTFGYRRPTQAKCVATFVNCFPQIMCHPLWNEAQALAPAWEWREHGINGRDGNLEPVGRIADVMAASSFGWHDKVHGDGMGHVIHNWAAVGRPLIGHSSHYAGKLAEPLWQDMVTCIDLDRRPVAEAVALMEEIVANPAMHQAMCEAIRARFDALVDFDGEARQIANALGLAA